MSASMDQGPESDITYIVKCFQEGSLSGQYGQKDCLYDSHGKDIHNSLKGTSGIF